jgi:stage II sporulation protein P
MRKAVYGKNHKGGFGRWLAGLALFFLLWMAAGRESTGERTTVLEALRQDLAECFADALCVQFLPQASELAGESCAEWTAAIQVENLIPLYGVARRELWSAEQKQSQAKVQTRVLSMDLAAQEEEAAGSAETEAISDAADMQMLLQTENQLARTTLEFVPHEQQIRTNLEELRDYETLVKNFYTIDSNTMAGSDQLQVDVLLNRDMTLTKQEEGPQILIYHTHSQEAFADSVPGDAGTTIEGVGERLCQILQEQYGYRVLHHTGRYDVESRNDAYSKALPELEKLLEENPSIQVVIDLHRDEVASDTKLVIDLDGRPTARFMFFNGLSRTKQSGDITYLKNENIADNLAFSFQMQLKCEEYYPGLTRKIYLKGYRYNMHLRPRSLLVELGAQNNTVEEAMNACDPLAHVLAMVLSGE